jgi:hypothetical protein
VKTSQSPAPGGEAAMGKQSAAATAAAEAAEAAERLAASSLVAIEEIVTRGGVRPTRLRRCARSRWWSVAADARGTIEQLAAR